MEKNRTERRPRQSIDAFESVFVAKQPVYDRDGRVWGYELLFRDSGWISTARIHDHMQATAQIIVDGMALAKVEQGLRVMLNFSKELLLEGLPQALPKDSCVVEILEDIQPDEQLLQSLHELRRAGYSLALDDYVGQKELFPLLEVVDTVKVDFLQLTPSLALSLTENLQGRNLKLLAEKIENEQMYQLAWVLGYNLFQGYWFSRPTTYTGRKVSMGDMAKMRLLRELSREDYEVKALARIINADSSLSYRLLKYVNSVSFSFRTKVKSLKQVVTLMGSKSLKQWLMAVVLADAAPTPRAQELAYRCVQRGRFLELCASVAGQSSRSPETMFLLGLFSLLDALLGQKMDELMREMPLEEAVRQALIGDDNKERAWLDLCGSIEQAQWEKMEALVERLGIQGPAVARFYGKATSWACDIVGLCEAV